MGIAVGDLGRSLAFYRDRLGFVVVDEFDVPQFKLRVVFLKAGNGMIELLDYQAKEGFQKPSPSLLGLRHITVLVEDLDGAYEKLKEEGFTFTRAPTVILPGRIRNAFLLGPDGELVELIERRG
ncbi:MAG: VOC family protein [Candidatus Bathyarchaeia archaeon]